MQHRVTIMIVQSKFSTVPNLNAVFSAGISLSALTRRMETNATTQTE
jgi:hypothetical protein